MNFLRMTYFIQAVLLASGIYSTCICKRACSKASKWSVGRSWQLEEKNKLHVYMVTWRWSWCLENREKKLHWNRAGQIMISSWVFLCWFVKVAMMMPNKPSPWNNRSAYFYSSTDQKSKVKGRVGLASREMLPSYLSQCLFHSIWLPEFNWAMFIGTVVTLDGGPCWCSHFSLLLSIKSLSLTRSYSEVLGVKFIIKHQFGRLQKKEPNIIQPTVNAI